MGLAGCASLIRRTSRAQAPRPPLSAFLRQCCQCSAPTPSEKSAISRATLMLYPRGLRARPTPTPFPKTQAAATWQADWRWARAEGVGEERCFGLRMGHARRTSIGDGYRASA